jgi:hypothetical protein
VREKDRVRELDNERELCEREREQRVGDRVGLRERKERVGDRVGLRERKKERECVCERKRKREIE